VAVWLTCRKLLVLQQQQMHILEAPQISTFALAERCCFIVPTAVALE